MCDSQAGDFFSMSHIPFPQFQQLVCILGPSSHLPTFAKRPRALACMGWLYSYCLGAISLSYAGALWPPVSAPARNLTFSPMFALLLFKMGITWFYVFYDHYA